MSPKHPKQSVLLVVFIAAILGIIFFGGAFLFLKYFYFQRFHSDSVTAYIFSSIIGDQKSIFPSDFIFGNELFFLRPQFSIFFVRLFGLSGYLAYSIGASFNIAICAFILSLCASFADSWRLRSAIIAPLALIPFGIAECDFLIGQQSHLITIVLDICALLLTAAFIRTKSNKVLGFLLTIFLLLAIDSPVRVIMFFTIYAITGFLFFHGNDKKYIPKWLSVSAVAIVCGAIINTSLCACKNIVGLSGYFALNSFPEMVHRGWFLIKEFCWGFLGISCFDKQGVNVMSIISDSAKILVGLALLSIAIFSLWVAGIKLKHFFNKADMKAGSIFNYLNWFGLVGSLCVFAGFLMVVMLGFNLDVRHFIAGAIILKLVLLLNLAHLLGNPKIWQKSFAIFGIIIFIAASDPIMAFFNPITRLEERRAMHSLSDQLSAHGPLRKLVDSVKTPHLYGTFWNSLKYEALLDVPILTAPIQVFQGRIIPFLWLTRPSNFDFKGDVIYVVNKENEQELYNAIKSSGAVVRLEEGPLLFLVGPNIVEQNWRNQVNIWHRIAWHRIFKKYFLFQANLF